MLTCPLAAGKVLCSGKDNMTQVCVTKVSLTATMRRTKEHKNNRPAVVCLCTALHQCLWQMRFVCDNAHSYLHEVNAVWSLKERLHWAQEFLCFPALLAELQNLLGVFPHKHGESVPEHLHGFGLVHFEQRMHHLILGSHALLQFRHCVLWRGWRRDDLQTLTAT